VKFDKLVRDKIPEIIHNQGKTCQVERVSTSLLKTYLADKLMEESQEFKEDPCLEELADIYEVLLTNLRVHGFSYGQLVAAAAKKATARGKFEKRLVLKEVSSATNKE